MSLSHRPDEAFDDDVSRDADRLLHQYAAMPAHRAADVFMLAAHRALRQWTRGVAEPPSAGRLQGLVDTLEPAAFDRALEASMARSLQAIFAGTAWLTAAEVGRARDPEAANPHSTPARWRAAGRIFGVEHRGQTRYPRYLFDALMAPIPAAAEVLAAFGDTPPLAVASWFESPNSWLDGARPRELLATQPQRVVAAAHDHLAGPLHG